VRANPGSKAIRHGVVYGFSYLYSHIQLLPHVTAQAVPLYLRTVIAQSFGDERVAESKFVTPNWTHIKPPPEKNASVLKNLASPKMGAVDAPSVHRTSHTPSRKLKASRLKEGSRLRRDRNFVLHGRPPGSCSACRGLREVCSGKGVGVAWHRQSGKEHSSP